MYPPLWTSLIVTVHDEMENTSILHFTEAAVFGINLIILIDFAHTQYSFEECNSMHFNGCLPTKLLHVVSLQYVVKMYDCIML